MRNRVLERNLHIMRMLWRGHKSLDELAVSCGVTTRTIRRDLETLSVCGFPLVKDAFEDSGDLGLWHLDTLDQACPVCQRKDGR